MDSQSENAAALLTVDEMARSDRAAIASGTSGEALMEAAGAAVVEQIRGRWASRPVTVLCGPGNNGGDGFVVARLLGAAGWPVTVALLGPRDGLAGDAKLNADRWEGAVLPLTPDALVGAELVVDAIFGAGLNRAPTGDARATIEALNLGDAPCVSVDVPSGVHGDSGAVLGGAPRARLTVTFFRRKPGHLLMPGRDLAGDVVVTDIGIPDEVLADIAPRTFANQPLFWRDRFPWPRASGHKFSRGHALIAGGAEMTGAARLAARAAMRIGTGICTIASGPEVSAIYAADNPGILTKPVSNAREFAALLEDDRKNAVLVGPGGGLSRTTRDMALAALDAGRATVLDADALSVFADDAAALHRAVAGKPCLITPHDGEFRRIFRHVGDRLSRARAAAEECGAVVLLKGVDTVIAAPDGRAAINGNAPPDLATAGAGDVLAGIALGLLAQGVDPFDAGCMAAWCHGEAARLFGPGLVAEDIPEGLPAVLRGLKGSGEDG
jgi:ADP-dependent NAD(P)H-hydrate dehydratase / NAD(P)H-hydrate epimerase